MSTFSIGTTGRDYSTLQAWEDAAPANLVTAGVGNHVGECYNDSEFVDSTQSNDFLAISGSTTDSTHYKRLTCAAGQSFQDHASVRTNGLRYNVSNGVGIRSSANYAGKLINVTEEYAHIDRVQLKCDGANIQSVITASGVVGTTLKDIIAQSQAAQIMLTLNAGMYVNVLVIKDTTSTSNETVELWAASGVTMIGLTVVRPSNRTAGGVGIDAKYNGAHILQSAAIFGFTTPCSNTGNFDGTNSKNNSTDQASGLPGSSNQVSVTYTSATPFAQADSTGSLDLKAIAATALSATGFKDATNAPNDISGYVRATSPTIGAWELTAAAAGGIARQMMQLT